MYTCTHMNSVITCILNIIDRIETVVNNYHV